MVVHLVCNEETRVRFTAGPFAENCKDTPFLKRMMHHGNIMKLRIERNFGWSGGVMPMIQVGNNQS